MALASHSTRIWFGAGSGRSASRTSTLNGSTTTVWRAFMGLDDAESTGLVGTVILERWNDAVRWVAISGECPTESAATQTAKRLAVVTGHDFSRHPPISVANGANDRVRRFGREQRNQFW